MVYTYKQVGELETLGYSLYFEEDGNVISPFHDIPLWVDRENGILNQIIEIPRGKRAKLEISRELPLNPIKQDVKNGKLRYVAFEYPFNYGAFPQTWENIFHNYENLNAFGDNDPLDVVNISPLEYQVGNVVQVKVLGTYAMIDEGEADWKILVVSVNDPNAAKLNDIHDIENVYSGTLKTVFEFLRDYKIPDGKPPNTFGFDGKLMDRAFAVKVIEEAHGYWNELIQGKLINSKITISKLHTRGESPFKISFEEAASKLQ